jgi:predicted RNase H-like HicB family nuclease
MNDQVPAVIVVRAQWDPEAAVWVADSADVPGLATEADTVEGLQRKLPDMIADLFEANGSQSQLAEVPVSIVATALTRVSMRRP